MTKSRPKDTDAGTDAGTGTGTDTGPAAGTGTDAGPDAGTVAGTPMSRRVASSTGLRWHGIAAFLTEPPAPPDLPTNAGVG